MRQMRLIRMCCLLAAVLLGTTAFAQGYDTTKWRFSNPKQLGFSILDLDFFDNNNVIAVGSDGGIAKSTDGGKTWSYGAFTYVTPTGYLSKTTFYDVHYVTQNVAYAAGFNGGSSTSVYIGGALAKTSDGGITWNEVKNPLQANKKAINTVWFLNKDTGYIAGQWNTPDSIPKLYFTKNGGLTWDSLNAPVGGKTRVGYINNPSLPPLIWDVTAKGKEIYRIQFSGPNTGYIIGGGQSHFPPIPSANASTCLPTGSTTTTSANNASLVWKYSNGSLIDYSLSKERLGFSGIVVASTTCTSQYNASQITPAIQLYRAMNIINDSLIVLASFNNNIALRVYTGRNDSTVNMINGLKEPGRYELLSYPFPPAAGPNAQPPIPNPNLYTFSNPYNIVRASNGKLLMPSSSPVISPANMMWTSTDTARSWTLERNLPAGSNFSSFGAVAIDIAPNGNVLVGGTNGVMADSTPGGAWASTYVTVAPGANYNQIEFADCNNGMAVGAANITVTTDGGKTWIDKVRSDFAASFYTIGGFAYPTTGHAYFAVSNGIVYGSTDQGTTLDPLYSNGNFRMGDVAAIGDTIWAAGSANTLVVPTASRVPGIFRSINGGLNWTAYTNFFPGANAQTLTEIEFPSKLVGYAAGSRDTVWKTTDGGATWVKLPLPTPGVTPQITYSDMQAIDDNTVILTGNGFPRSVVFKTTDGGATWTDITSNALALKAESNIFSVMFHDAMNGYIAMGSGSILKTTNGGTSWSLELAPSTGFNALGFAPKKVPAAIPFQNHKLFAATSNIMEFGTTANVNVNFTTAVTDATCTAPSGGSITITASGGLPPYSYSINGGPFQSSNVFSGLAQGAKVITVKDAFCGTATATVNIAFVNNLTVNTLPANQTTVCIGKPTQLTASSAAGATFAWSPATDLSASNIANPVVTLSAGPLTYTVTASLNGCIKTQTLTVNAHPANAISAGPDKTILIGNQVMLQGSSATAAQSIAWTPVTGLISGANTLNPLVSPAVTTNYTMTVTDANGCSGKDDALVTVIPMCLKVMTAFTPNGDGQNDLWLVTDGAPCASRISVSVFNRYGNIVYKNDHYQNNWNGTYEGKPLPDGTYYYLVSYTLIDNTGASLKGSVTILR